MHSPDWTDAAVTTVGVRAVLVPGRHDGDAEGDPVVVVVVTAPAHGVTKANDDGTITYGSAPGFMGQDSFTYTRSDGAVEGTGAVAVTVELVGTDGDDALAGPAVDRNVIHGLEGADTLRITGTESSEIRVRVCDVAMTGFVWRLDLLCGSAAGNASVFGEW
jgi:hypothetical protein